jgi:hypothetical protein
VWSICFLGAVFEAKGEGVGRRHQMHGPSMSVGDLVAVDRGLALDVHDLLDPESGPRPEELAHPGLGDRTDALDPDDSGAGVRTAVGVDVEHDVGQQLRGIGRRS